MREHRETVAYRTYVTDVLRSAFGVNIGLADIDGRAVHQDIDVEKTIEKVARSSGLEVI